MKDIYSPLEIDEQWDQRAPMMEGDAIDDAMTHWAADKDGGGGVATMEPPAPTTTDITPTDIPAPESPTGIVEPTVVTPSSDDTSASVLLDSAPADEVDPDTGATMGTQPISMSAAEDENGNSTTGIVPTAEYDGNTDPEVANDTAVHEPSEDIDIQMHTEDSSTDTEDTIAAETITPVVEVHPDHPRPTPAEKFGADAEDKTEGDETRPASDEAVKELDHAVAELPQTEHQGLEDDKLFDEDHSVEHAPEESRTVRQAHEAAAALTKQIEAGLNDLSRKLEAKNAELRDLEAQKAALEDLGSHALLQDEFEAA